MNSRKKLIIVFAASLAVGVLLSVLVLKFNSGTDKTDIADDSVSLSVSDNTETSQQSETAENSADDSTEVSPEPTQPPDSLFAGMTKEEIESSPWMMLAYLAAIIGGAAMARKIKDNSGKTKNTKQRGISRRKM